MPLVSSTETRRTTNESTCYKFIQPQEVEPMINRLGKQVDIVKYSEKSWSSVTYCLSVTSESFL